MLRALIGTTIIAGAVLAVGASHGPGIALTGTKAPSSTSSFALDGDPSFGGTASFTATYSPMKWTAQESLYCTQNGSQVYLNVANAPSTSQTWNSSFTLYSQAWADNPSLPADCTAQLFYLTWQGKTITGRIVLGTSTFTTT
jgi:hypothetical protein